MAIHGSIEEAGLPDVLQLLTLGRKTGCLSVLGGETRGEIYLEAGRISHATISDRDDRLGDILVKSGRITQDQLRSAVSAQKRNSKKQLGRALLDSGVIKQAELERVVRLQVKEAVYALFTLKQGAFTFNADRRPPHQFLNETLDGEALLLEGARRVDEWSLIQKKIPSFDIVYRQTRDPHTTTADDLTDDQRRILALLDGTRDVAAVVDATGMSEFDAGKALYGLVLGGFAEIVERRTHVRHLDYRELLAWVVREAEFADPQRRKDAGRHIVDCPTCAERLRKIQVRKTEGTEVVAVAAVVGGTPAEPRAPRASAPRAGARTSGRKVAVRVAQPQRVAHPSVIARPSGPVSEAAVEPATLRRAPVAPPLAERRAVGSLRVAPSAPPVAAPPPPGLQLSPLPPSARPHHDRRSPDRRAVADRRQGERRASLERRSVVNASWGLYHEERRRGLRREDDRRPGHAGGRRASNGVRMGGMVASAAPPVLPAGPGERATGPRRIIGPTFREQDWSVRVPAPVSAVEPPFVGSIRAAAPADEPVTSSPAEPSATRPEPVVPRREPPASSEVEPPRTGDIEWLVSPEQSIEMLRAHRAQRRTGQSSLRLPPAPAGSEPASGTPVVPTPPSGPRRFSPITGPASSVPPEPPQTSPALGHLSWGDDVAHPQITWGGAAARPVEPRTLPFRTLTILVAVIFVGVLGYQAGQVARRPPRNAAPTGSVAAAPAEHRAAPPPQAAARGSAATPTPTTARPQTVPGPAPSPGPAQPRGRGVVPPASVAPAPANVRVPPGRAAPTPVSTLPAAQPPAPRPGAQAQPIQPPAAPPVVVAQPAPTVGVLRGVVRDPSGAPVPRARVTVRGTALAAVTDASGAYEIRDVPDGAASVQATADGYASATADTRARAGATVTADLALARPPAAAEPDRELADGGWGRVDRAEALSALGGTLGAIEGLSIESISKSTAGPRQRVRVVQLTDGGQRVVLTETRAGAAVSGGTGPARVTSLRVTPPSESYPLTTVSASFGNILITAKAGIAPDALRALVERLAEVR